MTTPAPDGDPIDPTADGDPAGPVAARHGVPVGPVSGIVVVTGTDTGVGKTIVTAAIAASATAAGHTVAVVKPGQTGTDPVYGDRADTDVVADLAAPATTVTLAEYPDPLAPLTAARISSLPPLGLTDTVTAVQAAAAVHDLVLVEGAGGLLVPMGEQDGTPWTVADLAVALSASAVVVTRPDLGTLNHTTLTLEALAARGLPGVLVLGSWPLRPHLVHLTNLTDLPGELHGLLPEGAGQMEPGVFRRSAPGWLTPMLYGNCDDPRTLGLPDDA